jgi:hypothetical protein
VWACDGVEVGWVAWLSQESGGVGVVATLGGVPVRGVRGGGRARPHTLDVQIADACACGSATGHPLGVPSGSGVSRAAAGCPVRQRGVPTAGRVAPGVGVGTTQRRARDAGDGIVMDTTWAGVVVPFWTHAWET